MTDTTFDEARRCPECKELGSLNGSRHIQGDRKAGLAGGTLHIFLCKNERCRRKDREWVVQTRPDGTVPTPSLHRDKAFPSTPGVSRREQTARARAHVDELSRLKEIPR